MAKLTENKIVRLWDRNNTNGSLAYKQRFWLVIEANQKLKLINLTSQPNPFWPDLKTKCKMLTMNTEAKTNNQMLIIDAEEHNSSIGNYLFNDCDCENGCIDNTQFEELKSEALQFRPGDLDTYIEINLSQLYPLQNWNCTNVHCAKTGLQYASQEDFLNSNNLK